MAVPLALNMIGPLDQEDRHALIAGKPMFRWHAGHEDLYVGQQNDARVLLLRGEAGRPIVDCSDF